MTPYNENNKHQFYLVYALAAGTLIAAIVSSNTIVIAFSAVSVFAATLLLNSGHIVNDFLIKRLGVVVVSGKYSLGHDLHTLCKQEGSVYKAISVAILIPRNNAVISNSALKDLIDSIHDPFEFSIELSEVDKTRMMENLRTRLRMKEIMLSRTGSSSYDKVNGLKRQIDMINGDISNLSNSMQSFEFVVRIKSICTSADEYEARSTSSRNIELLANKFSAAIAVDYDLLTGEKLVAYAGI
jgi:hypothetical protein